MHLPSPAVSYVVALCFSPDVSRVVLIRKERPTWQKGFYNGPGGGVLPGESEQAALAREFEEETGMKTEPSDWEVRLRLGNAAWQVAFGVTFREPEVRTTTDEAVAVVEFADTLALSLLWAHDRGSQSVQPGPHRVALVPDLVWALPLVLDETVVFPLEIPTLDRTAPSPDWKGRITQALSR